MEGPNKDNLMKILMGTAISAVPNHLNDIVSTRDIVLVVDTPQMAQEVADKIVSCRCAKKIDSPEEDMSEIWNYELGVCIYHKNDRDDAVIKLMNKTSFTPVLIVVGLVPEFLEDVTYIFKVEDYVQNIALCNEFYEWVIQHINLVMEEIKRSKNSTYSIIENNEYEAAYMYGVAVSTVWKSFFLSKGLKEDTVKEWQEEFLVWMLKSLNEKERFVGMYQITEAFCNLFFKFIDENDCFILNMSDFDEDVYGFMKEDKVILFDEESYWIPDTLLAKICKPLTAAVSYKQIKAELAEEGTLLCNDVKKTNYTVKKLFTIGTDKKIVRPRFIRIIKDTLLDENGLTAEQHVGLQKGVR